MKPKISPIALVDFGIINSTFKFIPPQVEMNMVEIVQSYEIDFDFAVFEQSDFIRVFVKSSINLGQEQKPGYGIFAEGVAIFNLADNSALRDQEKKKVIRFSTVSIAINSLRGFISSLTSAAPMGRYVLPSIDIGDLFTQKAQRAQERKAKKSKK